MDRNEHAKNIMISKAKIKFIRSLRIKKVRDEEHLFVIEGDKLIRECLSAGKFIKLIAGKSDFLSSLTPSEKILIGETEEIGDNELEKISTLSTPHNVLAVISYPEKNYFPGDFLNDLCVALEYVQDPGNLGTIMRAAAWFGIKNIVCSENCADVYNPKVVQASMGSFLNVNVSYQSLKEFLREAREKEVSVYGTVIDGEPIYPAKLESKGVIVLGNEAKGISSDLLPFISRRLTIPKFTGATYGIESLNVGMAASIVFSEFARRRNS